MSGIGRVANAGIVVATSIAPKNIETQQAAVDTWRAKGLRVLSVNCGAEIGLLSPHFPFVDFVDAGELDGVHTTRKLVYFDQLLAALDKSGGDVFGIVNSDIHLQGGPDLTAGLERWANGGLVFGARLDVAAMGEAGGTPYPHGFDYFFFDRSVLQAYPASPFRLGAPWWDLWAPLVPLARGLKVARLTDPIAMHVRHESAWSEEREWQVYGALFMDAMHRLADGTWTKPCRGGGNGDIWASFGMILSDRLFAHHRFLRGSLDGQDPTTQALIHATNDQIALVVGQSIRLVLERLVPAVALEDGR
jgi:hypothetical protein